MVIILYLIGLTLPGTKLPISRRRGRRSIDSVTSPDVLCMMFAVHGVCCAWCVVCMVFVVYDVCCVWCA